MRLDEGVDNHCNPSLTATPHGSLRIAYGPHGFWDAALWNSGRFKVQESEDGTTWHHVSNAGYGATYACLLTDSQGRDHLAYRGGTEPPAGMYERRLPGSGWDVTQLSVLRIPPQYTYVNPSLAIGPGDVLYAGFMYYYLPLGRSLGVCGVKSIDGGVTWSGIDGRPVTLPLAYDPDFAIPHVGTNPYLGSLAVDLAGNVVAFTHDFGAEDGLPAPESALLSVFRDGGWQTTALDPFLPEGWHVHRGNVTVDARDRILVVVDATRTTPGEQRWGHPSMECFLLVSTDGGSTFTCTQLSTSTPDLPNWLPNITRTGPNHDLRSPLVLYTLGVAGEGCQPSDRTNVYAVWVE
jgi:hypothetical protein